MAQEALGFQGVLVFQDLGNLGNLGLRLRGFTGLGFWFRVCGFISVFMILGLEIQV